MAVFTSQAPTKQWVSFEIVEKVWDVRIKDEYLQQYVELVNSMVEPLQYAVMVNDITWSYLRRWTQVLLYLCVQIFSSLVFIMSVIPVFV